MSVALRLLLVEDNTTEAELLGLELTRAGFELDCHRVDNGSDLRRQLTDHTWDIIVSDFAMPHFDGLRAFEVARELQEDVPFIFVSGALGEERAVEAMRAGARDYVLKTELSRLPDAVRRELASSRRDSQSKPPLDALGPGDRQTVGQVAHDFNNLLAIMISYTRFAQKGLEKDSRPYEDLKKVLEATTAAGALTGKLLALSKK